MSEEYRVNLDIYNGPLDLLLYLIRRDEVDVHDIPIARITQQYCQYVEVLQKLDPNLAGEFLVMAATLMEIKTRMLLPSQEVDEETGETLEIDPRADLVRQLLEYKAFKDAAGDLAASADEQARRFARKPPELDLGEQREVELEDVQIWDLFDAFRGIMEQIGQRPTHHEVIYDDTPVELHQADILDRLQREGKLTFRRIFEGRTSKIELVGMFIAVLELVRQKRIRAMQDSSFGEIEIDIAPEMPDDEDLEPTDPEAEDDIPDGPIATFDDEDDEFDGEADDEDLADLDLGDDVGTYIAESGSPDEQEPPA